MRYKRDAVIAGVYQSRQEAVIDRAQPDLWWECARGACRDAGIDLADIDGLVGEGPQGAGIRSALPGAALGHDLLGKPLRFQASSSIGAGASAAGLNLAMYAVAQGLADAVIIDNAVAGGAVQSRQNRDLAVARMAKLSGPYEYVYGTTRVSDYAVLAQRHMHEFGTTGAQLAEVAVAQRHGATLHPLSFHGHRGDVSVDDVLASPMIADPLHLLDCCAINQGGGAIIVMDAASARQSTRNPLITLLGYGEGHGHIDVNALPSMTEFSAAAEAASRAFELAGLRPSDISVAGIADHFTVSVLFSLEASGFCDVGASGQFVEGGTLSLTGQLPTNTSGGYLSFSHAGHCGVFTLIELVEQLRGSCGNRQVRNPRYAYMQATGGAMQNHCSAVLGIL